MYTWQAGKATIQLIAHEKEVFDLSFAADRNNFASVGADGSVRMFDLRCVTSHAQKTSIHFHPSPLRHHQHHPHLPFPLFINTWCCPQRKKKEFEALDHSVRKPRRGPPAHARTVEQSGPELHRCHGSREGRCHDSGHTVNLDLNLKLTKPKTN